MAKNILEFVLLYGLPVLLGGLAILNIPWRRERRFRLRRSIDAPRERVWRLYRIDPDNPASSLLYSNTVSARVVGTNPEIVEQTIDISGSGRAEFMTMHHEILAERKPEISITRLCERAGNPYPEGLNAAAASIGVGYLVTLSVHIGALFFGLYALGYTQFPGIQ